MTIDGGRNYLAWEGARGWSADVIALAIAASDVDVDLQNNSIVSKAAEVTAGVVGTLVNTGETTDLKEGRPLELNTYRSKSWSAAHQRIVLRNGGIDIRRGVDGIDFSASGEVYSDIHHGVALDRDFYTRLYSGNYLQLLPPTPSHYPLRQITLEEIQVRTSYDGSYGAVIQGAGTVVRNSVIDVAGEVGLWIFGPNAVIENNLILVNAHDPKSIYELRPADAPIRLHHADGAIIRNNLIVLRGTSDAPSVAAVNTKNITFENNTIYGLKAGHAWIKAFGTDTQVHEAGTKLEAGWKAWLLRLGARFLGRGIAGERSRNVSGSANKRNIAAEPGSREAYQPVPLPKRIEQGLSDPPCGGTDYFGRPLPQGAPCDRSKVGK